MIGAPREESTAHVDLLVLGNVCPWIKIVVFVTGPDNLSQTITPVTYSKIIIIIVENFVCYMF